MYWRDKKSRRNYTNLTRTSIIHIIFHTNMSFYHIKIIIASKVCIPFWEKCMTYIKKLFFGGVWHSSLVGDAIATESRVRKRARWDTIVGDWWHEKKALYIVDCFCFVLFVQRISPSLPPLPLLVMQKFRHFKKSAERKIGERKTMGQICNGEEWEGARHGKKETHCGKFVCAAKR